MKANELRIGNHIRYRNEIIEVQPTDILSAELSPSDFSFIPITEEWFLKFGFEKTKENFSTYDLGKLSIYMPSVHYEKGRTYFDSWVIIEKSPETVHQLQNLYFALTGEELTLKQSY